MPRRARWVCLLLSVLLFAAPAARAGSYKVYSTYLWHLQQPIYWPEKIGGVNRYQFAYESLGGSSAYPGHPQNNLADIFGLDDRKAAYQFRTRDSVASMSGPDAGAQLSYAGSLVENVWSLGDHYSLGYGPSWYGWIREGMAWKTTRGFRRLEPVGFAYHHALMPLVDPEARRKEIAINREIWWKAWGGSSDKSDHPKGFRCSEEAFSTRLIKDLVNAGYEWVIVPNHHLSRTHPNYYRQHGKGVYDPPNRADQVNPSNGGTWYSGEIDGRGSTESVPFSFQAHRAKYVDPADGREYRIIVVPMTDLGSYRDGYSQQGIDLLHLLNSRASNAQPCLALFSHDGDNAWGGGFSYYQEAVPSFTRDAGNAGYRPTTIQTFVDENPPPADDIVHVEDGAWFNAENDWGHPMFINWLWPPQRDRNSSGYNYNDPATYADIENGWAEDFRNWAVIVAAQNYVSTAEQMHRDDGGTVDDWRIQEPVQRSGTDNGADAAELAWHFLLASLDSGYMYYGSAIDMEVKPSLACNQAIQYARQITDANPASDDHTAPTVFIPQRYPWNPGSTNYSALTGYRQWVAPSDFYIWTLVHDVAGVASVTLKVRVDQDGFNPLGNNDNDTYDGGTSVGAWQGYPMNRRPGSAFSGNIFNDPKIDFFIMPAAIADEYWVKLAGYNNQLLDYYVEGVDARGNVRRSDIQHVFVGSQGGGAPVTFYPAAPSQCDDLVVTYNPAGRGLQGANPVYCTMTFDGWGTSQTNVMRAQGSLWVVTNAIPGAATNAIVNFRNAGSSVVDDNGGANWSVPVSVCTSPRSPTATVSPLHPVGCDAVTIAYDPGDGPLATASNVLIHVGHNGWRDVITPDPAMTRTGSVWRFVYTPVAETTQINFVFNDGQGVWDNNSARDWSVDVEGCGGGAQQLWLASGSPGVSSDPSDPGNQNAAGLDAFDFDLSGGDAVTTDQGGFGSFGHVYLNADAQNLYIGGIGANVGGSNNAMVVFVSVGSLVDDATNLWSISGLPRGLDGLHNLVFETPMDVAIVLGDEWGDGTFTNFDLGNGYNFGQGVFYLSRYGTFSPVGGARLAQFDGALTNVVSAADDDGNRLTDRWECAIPWPSLGATSVADIGDCRIAGVLANSSTNGVDRYLSGNYLGETAYADGARDAYNNFAFRLVTLRGLPVGLPGQDRDGDGMPDQWELRYFGGATNALPGADSDGDGLSESEECRLGTNPRSAASTFVITAQTTDGRAIAWLSVGGKRYAVDASTNLASPRGGFSELDVVAESGVPAGVGAVATFEDAAATNLPLRFYRVRLKE